MSPPQLPMYHAKPFLGIAFDLTSSFLPTLFQTHAKIVTLKCSYEDQFVKS